MQKEIVKQITRRNAYKREHAGHARLHPPHRHSRKLHHHEKQSANGKSINVKFTIIAWEGSPLKCKTQHRTNNCTRHHIQQINLCKVQRISKNLLINNCECRADGTGKCDESADYVARKILIIFKISEWVDHEHQAD